MAFPTITAATDDFSVLQDPLSLARGWAQNRYNAVSGSRLLKSSGTQALAGVSTAFCSQMRDAVVGPDTEVGVQIPTLSADGTELVGLFARAVQDGATTVDAYALFVSKVAGAANDTWEIHRIVNNGNTVLTPATVAQEVAAGDHVGFEVTGTGATVTLTGYLCLAANDPAVAANWTQIIQRLDTNAARLVAAGRTGIEVNTDAARLDRWFDGTVVVAGGAALSGTVAGVGTATGALTAPALLSGTVAGAGTAAGALTAPSLITGTLAGAGSVTGNLTVPGAAALSGTLDGAGSIAGSLTARALLTGTAAGAGTSSGALTAPALITGTAAGTGTATGALTASSLLSGTAAGTGAVTGALAAPAQLTGTASGTGTATGTLTPQLGGTLTGIGTVTGSLTVPGQAALAGSLNGIGAVTGDLTARTGLAGTITGSGSASGALTAASRLAGTLAGIGAVTGALGFTVEFLTLRLTTSDKPQLLIVFTDRRPLDIATSDRRQLAMTTTDRV